MLIALEVAVLFTEQNNLYDEPCYARKKLVQRWFMSPQAMDECQMRMAWTRPFGVHAAWERGCSPRSTDASGRQRTH
jgi:hypothetical protein